MAGLHDKLQAECFIHTWNYYPESRLCMWHTPNELIPKVVCSLDPHPGETAVSYINRCKREADKQHMIALSRMKAIGVVKGVVDLCLYWRRTLYLFDIKIGKDKIRPAQSNYISSIVAQGGIFNEINDLEQYKNLCTFIFKS